MHRISQEAPRPLAPTRRWLASSRDALPAFLPAMLIGMFLTLVAALLAGCSLHPGGAQIAYQRGDQLWVVNPDGSNPRRVGARDIIAASWSPDHHELVFRYAANAGAALPAGATWAPAESVSDLGMVSISGGQPTQITPSARGLARSDAWWDPQGNRLLYREYTPGTGLIASIYIESQNDQPVGIARKVIVAAATLPTLSPDGAQVAVIDPNGAVRVGAAAQLGAIVAQGALPRLGQAGSSLPARLLWQPGHDALVYPTQGQNGVALTLLDLATHKSRTLAVAMNLRDAAFSPDGSLLLLDEGTDLAVWPVNGVVNGQGARAVIPEADPLAQAYWSPDGRWLLLEDHNGARLIRASDWSVQGTLTYAHSLTEPATDDATPWRPAASSPWSADSSAFTFASSAATWQNTPLPTPQGAATVGLYTQAITQRAPQGAPQLIASDLITAPTWSYPDPSTTLLMAAPA